MFEGGAGTRTVSLVAGRKRDMRKSEVQKRSTESDVHLGVITIIRVIITATV